MSNIIHLVVSDVHPATSQNAPALEVSLEAAPELLTEVAEQEVEAASEEVATEGKKAGRPRSVSEETIAKFVELYQAGKTVAEIAEQEWCDCKPSTIFYHLKNSAKQEMRPRGRQRHLSEEQVALLVQKHAEGVTITKIRELPEMLADGKPFSLPTLSKVLKENGEVPRQGKRKSVAAAVVEAAPEAQ